MVKSLKSNSNVGSVIPTIKLYKHKVMNLFNLIFIIYNTFKKNNKTIKITFLPYVQYNFDLIMHSKNKLLKKEIFYFFVEINYYK